MTAHRLDPCKMSGWLAVERCTDKGWIQPSSLVDLAARTKMFW
jgi:hypothetical protein